MEGVGRGGRIPENFFETPKKIQGSGLAVEQVGHQGAGPDLERGARELGAHHLERPAGGIPLPGFVLHQGEIQESSPVAWIDVQGLAKQVFRAVL